MDTTKAERPGQKTLPFFQWAIPVLWGIVILSAVFASLIFVLPLDDYRLFGNVFEVAVAIFCMACCLYAYRTESSRILIILAAFAFFSYAISAMFWYLYSIALGRHFVFTTVSELGFLCFFLFFIAGISLEFRDEGMRFSTAVILFLLFLTVPIVAIGVSGDNQPVRLALLLISFIVIEQLVATSIRFGVFRYSILWAGICLYCLGWMIYCIRESIFTVYTVPLFPANSLSALTVYDILSLIGPILICSMALIQIGLFSYLAQSPGTIENC
jgi:hypothetical protein